MWGEIVREITVDNFAGGGGASTGIEWALGRPVDIAINHDPVAIAMHKTNHPHTRHLCDSVWNASPRDVAGGRPVSLCWLSPDCKHFSKAKGGKPVDKNIRGLAWIAVRWAATVRPRVIILENVEEFKTWGPLTKDGYPDPDKKGRTFNAFINALKRQGYQVDFRELRACDYGAPTTRKRFFMIARCDGNPIVWPNATHGHPNSPEVNAGILKPWRTAAEIIDWSLPCKSIFERKRPLAENTMRRIARGIKKFVIDNPNPFIIKVNHHSSDFRGQVINKPIQTITAKNGWGIVTPFISKHYGGGYRGPGSNCTEPLHTVTTKDHSALVTAFLAQYHSETSKHEARGQTVGRPMLTIDTNPRYALVCGHLTKFQQNSIGQDPDEPIHTVMAGATRFGLVSSHLIKFRGTNIGHQATEPLHTITAGGMHLGEVRAFLLKYYGNSVGQGSREPLHTITTKERLGLVTIHGQDYQIVDIGMRMLEPHELYAAQGFPADYIIDHDAEGNRFSKATQVAKCGNAVPPVLAEALTRANLPEHCTGNKNGQIMFGFGR